MIDTTNPIVLELTGAVSGILRQNDVPHEGVSIIVDQDMIRIQVKLKEDEDA